MFMRLLILSHAINMDGRAASQTVTDKLSYFLRAGADITVISAITGAPSRSFKHHQVLPLTPSALRFDLRHYLRRVYPSSPWTRKFLTLTATLLLGLPVIFERLFNRVESQRSWALPAFLVAWFCHRIKPFDLVLSSGGAMSAHVAGYWLKRYLKLAWVAEIHDPLVYSGWTKSSAQFRFSQWVEEKICNFADGAVWFTRRARDKALDRHPVLAARGRVIYAGADRPLMAEAADSPLQCKPQFIFAHFGSLSRTRSLLNFLRGLDCHLQSHPSWRLLIQVEIYGGALDPDSLAFVRNRGLEENVVQIGRLERDEKTGQSGRDRVLQRMTEVDCLLLLHGQQPVCEEYIPSKLYEYLWMGPIILGAVWRNPELDDILRSQGHIALRADDVAGYSRHISKLVKDWRNGRRTKASRNSPFTAKRSSEELLALLTQVHRASVQ